MISLSQSLRIVTLTIELDCFDSAPLDARA